MKTNYIVWVCSLKLTAYFMNFLSKRKTTQLYSITVGKKKKVIKSTQCCLHYLFWFYIKTGHSLELLLSVFNMPRSFIMTQYNSVFCKICLEAEKKLFRLNLFRTLQSTRKKNISEYLNNIYWWVRD